MALRRPLAHFGGGGCRGCWPMSQMVAWSLQLSSLTEQCDVVFARYIAACAAAPGTCILAGAIARRADRDRDDAPMATCLGLDCVTQLLGDLAHRCDVGARDQQGEFLAADAEEPIVLARMPPDEACDLNEHVIADFMAELSFIF